MTGHGRDPWASSEDEDLVGPQDPPAAPRDDALDTYRALLAQYRHALDLMSPRGFDGLETKLAEAERYADAVANLVVPEGPVLDLGSGAGLPGVVVAVRLRPRPVWWVERRRRRSVFLTQVAARAGLDHVRVADVDVRELTIEAVGPVAAVTAQAVASFAEVAQLTRHLWGSDVLLVSRKGPGWREEIAALQAAAAGWPAVGAGRGGPVVDVEVVRTEALHTRGSLIAVRVRGGSSCPSSV